MKVKRRNNITLNKFPITTHLILENTIYITFKPQRILS